MKQQTLATAADQSAGFEQYRKPTRRDEFLATMNAIVPRAALCEVIASRYPKGIDGRPPIGLERMLRIHFIQHWFNLADEACEDALYNSASLRRFVGIDLPSSIKNADNARDPEMHQTKKGQLWCFGMKLHIGVDSQSGLAHSAVVTPASVHDKHPLPDLLHGNERRVYGDSAYASQKALIASKAPHAKDFTSERVRNHKSQVDETARAKNRNKSRVRARAEHVFCVVERRVRP